MNFKAHFLDFFRTFFFFYNLQCFACSRKLNFVIFSNEREFSLWVVSDSRFMRIFDSFMQVIDLYNLKTQDHLNYLKRCLLVPRNTNKNWSTPEIVETDADSRYLYNRRFLWILNSSAIPDALLYILLLLIN